MMLVLLVGAVVAGVVVRCVCLLGVLLVAACCCLCLCFDLLSLLLIVGSC